MNYGHVDSLDPDEGVENLTDALSESREPKERQAERQKILRIKTYSWYRPRAMALFLINNVIKLSDDQLSRDPKISIRCLLCKLSQSIPLN